MKIFVTTELYPFTAGGIGRVIANILSTASEDERKKILILGVQIQINQAQFESLYKGVKFINVDEVDYQIIDDSGLKYPPIWAYTSSVWHSHSVNVMQTLKKIECDGNNIEYIEFPDWGGLAFATTQEKKLARAFERTTIGVRLHSTDAILTLQEERFVDMPALCLYSLERKSLADCDLIIGQLNPVADSVANFFGFNIIAWQQRLRIHPPPVLVDYVRSGSDSAVLKSDTSIVFSSKIQGFKRPDVFIRGCSGFLNMCPEYQGSVLLLAHSFDVKYQQKIESLIPQNLRHRFHFIKNCSERERNHLISASICVFPSAYESFCLAAYEASISGALVLLNDNNPAFGDDTPWQHSQNCLKFDGTASGLAHSLCDAFNIQSRIDRVTPPTSMLSDIKTTNNCQIQNFDAVEDFPLVSIIIPHYNLGGYLLKAIESINSCSYGNIEIIVVDDFSTDVVSLELLHKLENLNLPNLTIIKNQFNMGLSATRNQALAHVQGDYIVTLDADDILGLDFIRLCVNALQKSIEYDFVVTPAAYFIDDEESQLETKHEYRDYAVFVGEGLLPGLYQNQFSTATVFGRSSAFRSLRYDENLSCYEDWDFYMRANIAGHRFLVTSDIHFFYRRRKNSMVTTGKKNHADYLSALLRSKLSKIGNQNIPLYHLNYDKNAYSRSNYDDFMEGLKTDGKMRKGILPRKWRQSVRKRAHLVRDAIRVLRGRC